MVTVMLQFSGLYYLPPGPVLCIGGTKYPHCNCNCSNCEINFAGVRNVEVRPAISNDTNPNPNRIPTVSCHCWKWLKII